MLTRVNNCMFTIVIYKLTSVTYCMLARLTYCMLSIVIYNLTMVNYMFTMII